MSVGSRKLAVAILLAIPVCYSQGMGQDRNSPANLGQKINYAPQGTGAMSSFKKTITTVFWVGEDATAENGYIDNYGSYWDSSF